MPIGSRLFIGQSLPNQIHVIFQLAFAVLDKAGSVVESFCHHLRN